MTDTNKKAETATPSLPPPVVTADALAAMLATARIETAFMKFYDASLTLPRTPEQAVARAAFAIAMVDARVSLAVAGVDAALSMGAVIKYGMCEMMDATFRLNATSETATPLQRYVYLVTELVMARMERHREGREALSDAEEALFAARLDVLSREISDEHREAVARLLSAAKIGTSR